MTRVRAIVAGGDVASPSQTGILLLYRDAKPGREADAVRVFELKLPPPWSHGSGSGSDSGS